MADSVKIHESGLISLTELTGAIWRVMRQTASEWDCHVYAAAILGINPRYEEYDDSGNYIPKSERSG